MTSINRNELLKRIATGSTLEGLALRMVDGRIDVGGLAVDKPHKRPTSLANVETGSFCKMRDVSLAGLDMSRSYLESMRLFNCAIDNCVFDGCDLRDLRMWGTTVHKTRCRGADLRGAALGGLLGGTRNVFNDIEFSDVDMRRTSYMSAEFVRCSFVNARLDKVNFRGSIFRDCKFVGELKEVVFNDQAFGVAGLPPNEMKGVDFSQAQLRSVEFRGLSLGDVVFPSDEQHVVVDDFLATLDEVIGKLAAHGGRATRGLAAYLGVYRKWAGKNQQKGVLNKEDLLTYGGETGSRIVLECVARHRG